MNPQATALKVVTVEDDVVFREHRVALIGGTAGFRCVGAHRTAEAALKHLPVERPDVLLLDLELPSKWGLDLIPDVLVRWPTIVVLTIHDDPERIFPALEAGAVGHLVKPVSPARLLEALAQAQTGGSPMSSQIARLVVRRFQEQGHSRHRLQALSAREHEILEHVARGLHTKEIADVLGLSGRTVGSHLRNIYEKLHVHARAAAVRRTRLQLVSFWYSSSLNAHALAAPVRQRRARAAPSASGIQPDRSPLVQSAEVCSGGQSRLRRTSADHNLCGVTLRDPAP